MKRLLLVVALLLPALVSSPAMAAPPATGMCFSYTKEQWVQTQFTAQLVPCSTPHNGEVLGQVTIPVVPAATGYASPTVRAWAFRACQSQAVNYAWRKKGKYPKSSYVMPRSARVNVHFPSATEWDSGARWAACLGQSRNIKLSKAVARSSSVRGKGLKPYVCMNPRTWKGSKCSKPDAVRLTNQVWIPKRLGATYPGTSKMLKRTERGCRRLAKRGWTVRTWFVPGKAAWDRGNKYGFCELVK